MIIVLGHNIFRNFYLLYIYITRNFKVFEIQNDWFESKQYCNSLGGVLAKHEMLPQDLKKNRNFLWIDGEVKQEKILEKCEASQLGFKIRASCSMKYWFMCLINNKIETVPKAKFTSSFESK